MKVEPRGKYAGVKVHLDAEEVKILLALEDPKAACTEGSEETIKIENLTHKMAAKINHLLKEEPGLLEQRTPEQIAAALEKEEVSARLKKEVLAKGQDWKKIKVKVEVEK